MLSGLSDISMASLADTPPITIKNKQNIAKSNALFSNEIFSPQYTKKIQI
ncbi:hypothetical protein [Methanobrevibacter sp.]|nr:hypothetical protein [Methanobrevibacter sp.]MBQ2962583.1 hypothetical protein [Methanobrevibacter sp.]